MRGIKFRWFILIFVSICYLVNFIDRVAISIATEPIMKEYNFTLTQWGMILSAFFWGMVPMSLLAGIAADRWGAKKILGIGVTGWSVFTIATPLAFNYVSFLVARFFFGAFESPTLSNGMRIVSNWASPREYSTAVSVVFLGVKLGPAIGAPVIVWIMTAYGWRTAFYAMGILGFIWLIGWLKWFTDLPKDNRYMSDEEKSWLLKTQESDGQVATADKPSFKQLFSFPKETRTVLIANFWSGACLGYTYYFLMTWLPGYLTLELKMDFQTMGYTLMYLWLCAAASAVIGGKILDYIMNRTKNRRIWAYWQSVFFCIVAFTLFLIAGLDVNSSLVTITVLFAIAASALTAAESCMNSVLPKVAPRSAGSLGGIMQLAYAIPGLLAPIITGIMVDVTGSFANAFYLTSIILVTAVIVSFIFLKTPRQLEVDHVLTGEQDGEIMARVN